MKTFVESGMVEVSRWSRAAKFMSRIGGCPETFYMAEDDYWDLCYMAGVARYKPRRRGRRRQGRHEQR